MNNDHPQASAGERFLWRRNLSSYHSGDARAREETKHETIAAVLGVADFSQGKYHYGLFEEDTHSLSDAQGLFTDRLVELVLEHRASAASAGYVSNFCVGVEGASLGRFSDDAQRALLAFERDAVAIEVVAVEVISEALRNTVDSNDSPNTCENIDCIIVEGSYRSIDQLGFLSRARRLLKPGGVLIVFGEFLDDDSAVEHSPLPNLSSFTQLAERLNYSIVLDEEHTQSALRSIEVFSKQAQGSQLYGSNENVASLLSELEVVGQGLSSGKRAFKLYMLEKGAASVKADNEYAAAEYGDRSSFEPAAVADLFERSFGHAFDADIWHWKYEVGAGRCVVARANAEGELVAHYGGAPRDIRYFGREALAIQPCDVMVMPEERTRYGRGSLFFKTAATFLEREIGNTVDHLLGFGFPNKKTMRLAIRLGLYEKTDNFVELRLRGSNEAISVTATTLTLADFDAADKAHHDELEALWQTMQGDFGAGIIGVRNWEYINYRYLQHPHRKRYLLRWLRDTEGEAIALAVIKRSDDAWLVMDIVASLETVSSALIALAEELAQEPSKDNATPCDVALWVTKGWVTRLDIPNAVVRDLGIEIPCNSWNPGPPASVLYGKWWLTAGDMDFQ